MSTIPLDIQAEAAKLQALNYRGALHRHEELATAKPRPRWNPELLPSERQHAEDLSAVARTMEWLAKSPRAIELREALEAGQ